jgi:hypothetical protein
VRDGLHLATAERKVGELALVTGVNPGRAPAASWARRVARLRPDPKRDEIPDLLDAVHHGSCELRQKRVDAL